MIIETMIHRNEIFKISNELHTTYLCQTLVEWMRCPIDCDCFGGWNERCSDSGAIFAMSDEQCSGRFRKTDPIKMARFESFSVVMGISVYLSKIHLKNALEDIVREMLHSYTLTRTVARTQDDCRSRAQSEQQQAQNSSFDFKHIQLYFICAQFNYMTWKPE